MTTFALQIVTRARVYPERRVVSLSVPAVEGRLTVLARHEPFRCALAPGRVTIEEDGGRREEWTIESGALRVGRQRVSLVAESARGPSAPAGPPGSR